MRPSGEAWNETVFRAQATAMAEQLLPHGFNIITIDGGWSGGLLDDYGRPIPDPKKWPSSAGLYIIVGGCEVYNHHLSNTLV